ncbi:alkaline phosphatase family protein [Streptomyces sp. NPDC021093]|uniref:alkaline phosphatase family protein n=1 Tax=Streptomyces sp. NPDC021093 TaxID=3365112 RepID=UPI0037B8416E
MPRGMSRRTVLAGTATAAAAAAVSGGLAGAAQAAPAPGPAAAAAAEVPKLPNGTSRNKVLVVGMDGLRHDRIQAAKAPTFKSLMARGTFATSLLYAPPAAQTSSGPGWSTVSTGVWPDKHGVVDNSFKGKDYAAYPGFLARLRQVRPDLSTFAAVDWKPLDAEGTVTAGASAKIALDGDADGYVQHDATIAAAAETILRDQNPDVCFIYFGQSDIVGHDSGAMSPKYLEQIDVMDGYVGRMLAAIKGRKSYHRERWTILLTTDHGHADAGGHGGPSIEERRVFTIAQGPGIPAGAKPVNGRHVDTVATVLHALGITPDPAWGLDGRPLQRPSADGFDASYGLLKPAVDETGTPAGVLGFTHGPAGGWSIDNSRMPEGGVAEWRGWTLTTDEFWTRADKGQGREQFTRGRGVIAVADPDEWDDKGSPTSTGEFDSTLVSPAYRVSRKSSVTLTYFTHYLQDGPQRGDVLVSFDGAADQLVKNYAADAENAAEKFTLPVPQGARTVRVKFRLRDARNNWYWAVDDVQLG